MFVLWRDLGESPEAGPGAPTALPRRRWGIWGSSVAGSNSASPAILHTEMERHRLSPIEVESIATAVTQVVPMERLLSVRLFRSRANIDARGGDIDLWVACAEGTDVDPV
ncbi:MAG: hypothetical protein IT349_20805 [Candidatus Eisenbacteria bacterium]|nr:hypothetical protein [Candidatus Eisenbacteria bacterium]